MRISKEYVTQEVLDVFSLKQLNKENLPELSSDDIDNIVRAILFTWNEIGDAELDFPELVNHEINIYFDTKQYL